MLPVHPKLNLLEHSHLLLNSFRRWTNRELIDYRGSPKGPAMVLFEAPFIVVSHGIESDPILNYANQAALKLWEMGWEEFIQTPSRLTAEPVSREERARLLAEVTSKGFIDNYAGIRISRSGKRFRIENAVVWNLIDDDGQYQGQAATFEDWHYL